MSAVEILSSRIRRQNALLYHDCKTERRRGLQRRRQRRRQQGSDTCIDNVGKNPHHPHTNIGYLTPGCSRQYRDRIRRATGFVCLVSVCVVSAVASTTASIISDHQYQQRDETDHRRQTFRDGGIQSKKRNRENDYMRISWNLGDLDSPTGKSGKDGKSSTKSGKSKSDKTSPSWTSVPIWPSWPSWASSSTSPTSFDQSAEPSTENPSQTPTVLPTILPSISPTITAIPTTSPVQSPSASPTITLSSVPSTIPSISPTARPSIDVTSLPSTTPSVSPSAIPTSFPSFSPSNGPIRQPSSFPSKSMIPTAVPSLAASMLPSVSKTAEPSTMPSIAPSAMPTPQVSPVPSSQPSNSPTYVPTRKETEGPSSLPSVAPTIEISTDTRQDLKMSLFGLPNALLDTSQQQYYQLRTARYIEDFYNNDDGTNGILEAIKSEITNVTALLTIENQDYEENGGVVTNGTRMIPINEDDESYLPEFAVIDINRRHNSNNRLLQATTQVTEPCVGTSSLKITFSLELSYRTSDIYQFDSNAVIFFPFSATDFRTNYIDNYLKNPQFDDDEILNEEASAVFSDVYCTSRVVDLADTESTDFPTKSPVASTNMPSSQTTSVPSSSTAPSASTNMPSSLTSVPSASTNIPSSLTSVSPSYSAPSSSTDTPSSSTSVSPSPGEPTTLNPSLQSSSSIPSTRSPSTSISFSPSSISSVGPTKGSGGSSGPTISTKPSSGELSVGPTTSKPSSLLPVGSTSPTLPTSEQPTTVAPSSSVPTGATNNTSVQPTVTNVVSPTQLPTTPLINPGGQIGNAMALYGLTAPLSRAEKAAWNSRTTSYILSYYNDYKGQGGIRGDIYDVGGYLLATTRVTKNVRDIARSDNNILMRFNDEWTYWNDVESEEEYHGISRSYEESYETNENIGRDKTKDSKNKQVKAMHKNVIIVPHKGPRKFDPTARNVRQLQGCGGESVDLVFSINLRYRNRGATEWTLNQIVNEPFRTWKLRNDYMNNVLRQPGDPVDLFDGLSCTGSIVFPPGSVRYSTHEKRLDTFHGTTSPTTSAVYLETKQPANYYAGIDPSTEENHSKVGSDTKSAKEVTSMEPSTDDIFINLRMINNGTNERKCNGEIRPIFEKMEEFELSFMYGVESSSNDVYELTDDLENIVLDFLASRVLVCASERDVNTVQRSQYSEREIRELGVVRIRYPEYGEITSIADCDPFISSRAKSCAIMNTKLLVTSVDESKSEVSHDILLALTKAFNENKFGESIPNLSKTSYIGPDPESLTLSSSLLAATMLSTGGTPRTSAIAVSMGCSLLILIVALCLVCRRSSKEANAIHSSRFSRRQHKPIPTQEEEAEKTGLEVQTNRLESTTCRG